MTIKSNNPTFWDHLDELRGCVLKCAVVVTVFAAVMYNFVGPVLGYIIRPVGKIVFTSVADAFTVRLQLALLLGLFVSLPYVVWQVWSFVSAGLKEHERKYVLLYGPFSACIFLIGGLFAYFVIVPVSISFLLSFATEQMVPMITVKSYVSFVSTLVIAFGVVFELPLVMLFLTQIGVATPEFLSHYRRHAVIGILILSAIITPPDCITQLMMSVPLIALYEGGILASRIVSKQKPGAEQA